MSEWAFAVSLIGIFALPFSYLLVHKLLDEYHERRRERLALERAKLAAERDEFAVIFDEGGQLREEYR